MEQSNDTITANPSSSWKPISSIALIPTQACILLTCNGIKVPAPLSL